jgi:Tfp pilus assembly protein PilF
VAQSGPGSRTIDRHWPDDGAERPEAPTVRWEGKDAVGLQFHERDARANVVPVSFLKMPPAAIKEMQKSDKALVAGDVRGSAEHLEKMLVLTPDFAIGHNSLGTRYVVLQQYDKAVEEFEKAVALQPKYRLAVDNIAVTLCMQHRYMEAEQAARSALQIQPDAASSKYLLGSILVNEDKTNEESTRLLESVQAQYPRAKLFLAKSYLAHGDPDKAVQELREYVSSPQAADNGVAAGWLAKLEKEMNPQGAIGAGQHD